jgi:diacylglycerol kinase family enzyme
MRPGDPWGVPAAGEPDAEGAGGDAELASFAGAHHQQRVRFVPDEGCDFARAVGLTARSTGSWEVAIDVMRVGGRVGVNMLTVGTRPDRIRRWTRSRACTVTVDGRVVHDGTATSVVVANGQYLAGLDVVPRGHPGDGRLEVQVYALAAGERRAMRARLRSGTHLPHPRILTASGRSVEIRIDPAAGAELDGSPVPGQAAWTIEVVPAALRLLV